MIILLGRSLPKVQPVVDAIHKIDSSIITKFISISLDSLASVRGAAEQVLDDDQITHIDVLINNAAVMACPYGVTEDGFETQFATNHLSHFLLTNLLKPKILAAPAPRIVNVSSLGHLKLAIQFDDIGFSGGKTYNIFDAYGQAKTANILFTVSLNERLRTGAGTSWALHPGSIASGLQKHITPEQRLAAIKDFEKSGFPIPERKTLQQGCATTLRAALDPKLRLGEKVINKEGKGGRSCYLSDCQVVNDKAHIAPYALDGGYAARLWEISEDMVGQKFEW
jgi:NAD(P)-dependent dehydrogenase (short-subunit alcohol dehydrogenase family)